MTTREFLHEALGALAAHRLRTVLSSIGTAAMAASKRRSKLECADDAVWNNNQDMQHDGQRRREEPRIRCRDFGSPRQFGQTDRPEAGGHYAQQDQPEGD